jgi:predicted nucleotidyltransferase
MGHYASKVSDMNIVVYGKHNFWKLMSYLETAHHPHLRWKNEADWLDYYQKRNRFAVFGKDSFLKSSMRKKSEGYFNNTLFVIFAAEKEEEVSSKWGAEKYEDLGIATVEGVVADDFNSVVRPGYYAIKDASVNGINISKIVFHSRDYCMLAKSGEKIQACGILEKVTPDKGEQYYRIVVGYFDSYVTDRREQEFIRLV